MPCARAPTTRDRWWMIQTTKLLTTRIDSLSSNSWMQIWEDKPPTSPTATEPFHHRPSLSWARTLNGSTTGRNWRWQQRMHHCWNWPSRAQQLLQKETRSLSMHSDLWAKSPSVPKWRAQSNWMVRGIRETMKVRPSISRMASSTSDAKRASNSISRT